MSPEDPVLTSYAPLLRRGARSATTRQFLRCAHELRRLTFHRVTAAPYKSLYPPPTLLHP